MGSLVVEADRKKTPVDGRSESVLIKSREGKSRGDEETRSRGDKNEHKSRIKGAGPYYSKGTSTHPECLHVKL